MINEWLNKAKENIFTQYRLPIVVGGIILAGCMALYGCSRVADIVDPPQPITTMSQQQAEMPSGVKEAADNAKVGVTQDHAAVIAEDIRQAVKRPPDKVLLADNSKIKQTIEQERKDADADFTIVTDAKNSDIKPELDGSKTAKSVINKPESVIDNSKTVTNAAKSDQTQLNVYNIKAFPNHLVEASYYTDGSGDVAYMSKFKFLGAQAYVGPAVKYDAGKVKVGVRVTVPF